MTAVPSRGRFIWIVCVMCVFVLTIRVLFEPRMLFLSRELTYFGLVCGVMAAERVGSRLSPSPEEAYASRPAGRAQRAPAASITRRGICLVGRRPPPSPEGGFF